MNKSQSLEAFLSKYLESLEPDGGSGGGNELPSFELYALDYLEFAEKRLNNLEKYKDDVDELINCVAHLKRAVDCQLDTFFHCCNLYKKIQSRNLKFETKLEFLKGIGVFSSRSLNRLNTLRNKMEHQYEVPKIGDIELYYDLVSAFISVIQGLIFLLRCYEQIDFSIKNNKTHIGSFSSRYNTEKLSVTMWWKLPNDETEVLTADFSELEDFTYFFKVHILLVQLETFTNWNHIYNKVKLPPTKVSV